VKAIGSPSKQGPISLFGIQAGCAAKYGTRDNFLTHFGRFFAFSASVANQTDPSKQDDDRQRLSSSADGRWVSRPFFNFRLLSSDSASATNLRLCSNTGTATPVKADPLSLSWGEIKPHGLSSGPRDAAQQHSAYVGSS